VPEVRRLLLTLAEPVAHTAFRLGWSLFRRQHQAIAQRCHAARRAHQHPLPPMAPSPSPIQVLAGRCCELSDAHWERIAPLLPPLRRHPRDDRLLLAGMLWMAQSGGSWHHLPTQFGPWKTVYDRSQRWRRAGIWQQILATFTHDSELTVT
jgi:hypothetical protein